MTGNVARLVTVQVNPESCAHGRHVFVTSKEVPGLYMMGASFISMQNRIAKAITELFRLNKQLDVKVYWIAEDKTLAQKPAGKRPAAKSASKATAMPERHRLAVVLREAA